MTVRVGLNASQLSVLKSCQLQKKLEHLEFFQTQDDALNVQ